MKATAAKKNVPAIITAEVDQAEVKRQLVLVEAELRDILGKASNADEQLTVEDDEDYEVACALLLATVVKRKKVAAWKAGFMEKVKALVDYVEGEFAEPEAAAAAAEKCFRQGAAEYIAQLDAKAAGLRKAAAHLPARDSDRADEMLSEAKACVPPKVQGISIRRKLALEIVDEKKIPEKFWTRVVDTDAIEKAIEDGIAVTVPGVRASVDVRLTVTPSNAKGLAP